MVTKSDIADKVDDRISGIPSAVTSATIQVWVEDAHIIIENRTGDSFDTSDIPARFQAVITDIAVSYLLDYMIKKRITIGEIGLNYQDLINQKRFLDEKIEKQLVDLSRGSTTGAMTTTQPLD